MLHKLFDMFFGPKWPHVVNLENGEGYTPSKAQKVSHYLKTLDSFPEKRSYLMGQIEYAYQVGNRQAMRIGFEGSRILKDAEPTEDNIELHEEARKFMERYG